MQSRFLSPLSWKFYPVTSVRSLSENEQGTQRIECCCRYYCCNLLHNNLNPDTPLMRRSYDALKLCDAVMESKEL